MYKKALIGAICILILAIIVVVIILMKKEEEKNDDNGNTKIYELKIDEDLDVNDYIIIRNSNSLKELINNSEIKEFDFEKNDYLIFKISYDSCSESDFSFKGNLLQNELVITMEYNAKCGVCAPDYLYYYIKLEKNQNINSFEIKYKQKNEIDCPSNVAYKPIIYLYPESDINVSISLKNSTYLTTTYPKYNNGWKVFAKTDGTLIDLQTNREYYGLYWEGNNHYATMKEDGFIVKGEEIGSFLEEKLKILGLTDREADEFIIYWLPILEKNTYNYIRFETMEEINNYMPIDINPKPDTIIRILMDYKPLEKKINIKKQELITPKRTGFTVVEWGGSKID